MLVCHCGHTADNHHFKHPFSGVMKVSYKKNMYTFNAKDFPLKKREKCSYPQCNGPIGIHGTVIQHAFQPVTEFFREIKLFLADDSVCFQCNKMMCEHTQIFQHPFTVKVLARNKGKLDTISILSSEDRKIKII